MKTKTNISSFLLLLITTICFGENLDISISVGINKMKANYWIKTLQEAYNQFLLFFLDLANNTTALELKALREFKVAATICFNAVKGKHHDTLEALETTITDVTYALSKAIKSGSQAAEDLNFQKETKLVKKLSDVMEKFKNALKVTTNLIPITKKKKKQQEMIKF